MRQALESQRVDDQQDKGGHRDGRGADSFGGEPVETQSIDARPIDARPAEPRPAEPRPGSSENASGQTHAMIGQAAGTPASPTERPVQDLHKRPRRRRGRRRRKQRQALKPEASKPVETASHTADGQADSVSGEETRQTRSPHNRSSETPSHPATATQPKPGHIPRHVQGAHQARSGRSDYGHAIGANHHHVQTARLDRRHTRPRDNGASGVPDRRVYGALDLGTNNCRLLLARPSRRGFRVIDAFSRIIRLGEGIAHSGALSDAAMQRTIEALRVCATKIERNGVHRARLVATEACRVASNGRDFLDRAREETGLSIEILTPEMEASLAVAGCATLIDTSVDLVLVFDIGGGSSELIWLDLTRRARGRASGPLDRHEAHDCMAAWTSLPVGVVTLAERFGGRHVTPDLFEAMVEWVTGMLAPFEAEHGFRARLATANAHLLGTSGTVTTVAGIQLRLPRYDRSRVDGTWMRVAEAHEVTYSLLHRSYDQRVAEPCIGRDRADLVLAGCAILEALMRMWPCDRLRVADRGLREGILANLMSEDGVLRNRRRR